MNTQNVFVPSTSFRYFSDHVNIGSEGFLFCPCTLFVSMKIFIKLIVSQPRAMAHAYNSNT